MLTTKKRLAQAIAVFMIAWLMGCNNHSSHEKDTSAAEIADPVMDRASGARPPMGWNSWNWFGKKLINEQVVREVIDAMVKEGLRDAGYNYVIVDGGWRDTKLADDGTLLTNTEKFPGGMKALADYAHANGLKFGVHTVPGTHDCTGDKVGGYGHEEVQFRQLAGWGVDFIKLDLCRFEGEWNEQLIRETYTKWSRLIKESGKDILLSISAYQFRSWYPGTGVMARTTEDISTIAGGMSGYFAVFDDSIPKEKNKWDLQTVMQIAEENNKWAAYARPGYWNDPDMLVTGEQGLSQDEQKSHFALWCIMSAPLMLGNDPRHMKDDEKKIILNKDCIRIDQDTAGQGIRIKTDGSQEVWAKKLQGGRVAVLLLNRDKTTERPISIDFATLGNFTNAVVKDVYEDKDLGSFSGSFARPVKAKSGFFVLIDPR